MQERIKKHFTGLGEWPLKTIVTDKKHRDMPLATGFKTAIKKIQKCGKIIFVGNGGSAAIASHMAEDYTKNGGIRAIAFNDATLLTCLANDYGYDLALAKAVGFYADRGDLLVAISSSGKSVNILEAVHEAHDKKCQVITLSGFGADNILRQYGDLNFWVPAQAYGFVEITHLSILHGLLDFICEDNK